MLHTLRFRAGDRVRLRDRILGCEVGTETTVLVADPSGVFPYRLDLIDGTGVALEVSENEIEGLL